MGRASTSKPKVLLRTVAVNVGVLCLLLLAEGLASFLLLGSDILATRSLAERHHTGYAPDLGWVNIPDLHLPDMYGPGVYLRTNHQGFRARPPGIMADLYIPEGELDFPAAAGL